MLSSKRFVSALAVGPGQCVPGGRGAGGHGEQADSRARPRPSPSRRAGDPVITELGRRAIARSPWPILCGA